MKKEILVVFTENGARIEKDPAYISEHKNDENVLYNPILPHGVPPSFWIKDGDKIGFTDDCEHEPIIIESATEYKKLNAKLISENDFLNLYSKGLDKKIEWYKFTIISLIVLSIGLACHL
jgi:hypothetical protein